MGFSFFSTNASPIAIDFGSASIKMLQISEDDAPRVVAAAEIEVPESIRLDPVALADFYGSAIPDAINHGKFKGKRVVLAIPSVQTFIQHMQLANVPGTSRENLIKAQLQSQMGCAPDSIVVRSVEVADVHRDGQARTEIICFAIARDIVMRYVNTLKKCKLNVVGIHTEALAMVRAFDHLNRRASDDDVSTLYVDVGWAGTHVAIGHGKKMVFARHIQIGGRHFDEHIAKALRCDIVTARSHRLSLGASAAKSVTEKFGTGHRSGAILSAARRASASTTATDAATDTVTETEERRTGDGPVLSCQEVPDGNPPSTAANVDISEQLDTIADELSMCLRYHRGLFAGRDINRSIFVGGEARQVWLCQHIVKSLRLPAQLGDPLSRLGHDASVATPGLKLDEPQPGWAVAYGLCTAPTDL